jgi:outer membrane protein OmpA-like peptidoglycan-associated protein
MIQRFSGFILCLFCLLDCGAQTDTLRLFYGVNQIQSETNNKRIDSLFGALHGKFIKVRITGYADFLSGTAYNLGLSQKRAEAVKAYMGAKAAPSQIQSLTVKAVGEKYSRQRASTSGEPFQRRVDVVIEPFVITQHYDAPPTKKTLPDTIKRKRIENLEKGESLAVEGLNFIPGRHFLVKEATPVLNELLKTLQENPSLKIEIQGHICCVVGEEDGTDVDTHEKKLSYNRAQSIYLFLVKNGIDPDRLTFKGYGRKHPKVWPEITEADEQANRRVEIKIIEK